MTGRSKNVVRSFETEIEKCREESNWKKAVEIAHQLKQRSPQHESLSHFLIGEGKLEAYLEEWPPIKENFDRAIRELNEAKSYLTSATDENGKKAGVALDAHLLLGKLCYACGAYDDSLKNYKMAELNTLTEKELPVRSLRIVAESYAIKGLCLELTTIPGSSRIKQAEKEAEMIRSFELASELTLLYLQKTNSPNVRAGPTLETALQRAPILHMRAGRLQSAVDRYREMLTAVESQSTQEMRLTLTRQLAEVLLRGVSGQVYAPPTAPTVPQGTLSRRREEHVSEGPWKPKKYAGLNQFVARNECEEVILLLLIGEAMAVRDAVLSQSPEFERARLHAYENATAIYDLLALATMRWGQATLLNESLERAMKFSFGEPHVWRQRALVTAAAVPASQHAPAPPTHTRPGGNAHSNAIRAHSVMEHAVTLMPKDASLRLTGAKTCYQMGWIDEGLELSEAALQIEEEEPTFMEARCYLYVGIGYQMKGQATNARNEKQLAHDKSLKYLLKSVQLDANDHLSLYYLALQYALLGMLNEAMDATRSCLNVLAECAGGLRLLTALWSMGAGSGTRALEAAALARHHHPACEWLARAHATLLLCRSGEEALAAGKELLVALKNSEVESETNGYTELDAESDSHYTHNEIQSNRDANSLRASSVGVWRAERALSEGASSLSSPRPRASVAAASQRASAWLLLAELCLKLNRVSSASGCVSEASSLAPFSHQVMHMRGMVHAHSEEWTEARQCFQNALAIHPTHIDSLIQLGIAHHRLGWLRLAEKVFRDAAQLEPDRAEVWRELGSVLEELDEHEAAADCMAAALELDVTTPLLPFSTLPYMFQ